MPLIPSVLKSVLAIRVEERACQPCWRGCAAPCICNTHSDVSVDSVSNSQEDENMMMRLVKRRLTPMCLSIQCRTHQKMRTCAVRTFCSAFQHRLLGSISWVVQHSNARFAVVSSTTVGVNARAVSSRRATSPTRADAHRRKRSDCDFRFFL